MVDAHYSPKIIAIEGSSTEAPNDCYFTAKATAIITVATSMGSILDWVT